MMKVIALSVMFLCQSVVAQTELPRQNTITVNGSVELKEVADEASLTFFVRGVGSSLRLAVEDANAKVKAVTNKLVTLGVKSTNISTSNFYSGENYGDKSFWTSKRDFKADISSVVRVDSLNLLELALYAISESDIENISDIRFSFRDELGLRRRARIAASLKAKEKAEDIAKALGVSVGKVILVEEVLPSQVGALQTNYLRGGRVEYSSPFNPSSTLYSSVAKISIDEQKGFGFFCSNNLDD